MPLILSNIVETKELQNHEGESAQIDSNSLICNNEDPINLIQSVNFTLPMLGVLKQLKNLSIYSHHMFEDLFNDIQHMDKRVKKLQLKSLKVSKKFEKTSTNIKNATFCYHSDHLKDFKRKCDSSCLSVDTRNRFLCNQYQNIQCKLSFNEINNCVAYFNEYIYPKYKDAAVNRKNRHFCLMPSSCLELYSNPHYFLYQWAEIEHKRNELLELQLKAKKRRKKKSKLKRKQLVENVNKEQADNEVSENVLESSLGRVCYKTTEVEQLNWRNRVKVHATEIGDGEHIGSNGTAHAGKRRSSVTVTAKLRALADKESDADDEDKEHSDSVAANSIDEDLKPRKSHRKSKPKPPPPTDGVTIENVILTKKRAFRSSAPPPPPSAPPLASAESRMDEDLQSMVEPESCIETITMPLKNAIKATTNPVSSSKSTEQFRTSAIVGSERSPDVVPQSQLHPFSTKISDPVSAPVSEAVASTATSAPPVETTHSTIPAAPDGLEKYRKMSKLLPEGAVRHKMMADGIPDRQIDIYFGANIDADADSSNNIAGSSDTHVQSIASSLPETSSTPISTAPKPTMSVHQSDGACNSSIGTRPDQSPPSNFLASIQQGKQLRSIVKGNDESMSVHQSDGASNSSVGMRPDQSPPSNFLASIQQGKQLRSIVKGNDESVKTNIVNSLAKPDSLLDAIRKGPNLKKVEINQNKTPLTDIALKRSSTTGAFSSAAVDAILERRKRLQNDVESSDDDDDDDWL